MDLELIVMTIFLGITGIAMGSIGINCYNKHGSIRKNYENEPNYRYLIFMLIFAIFVTLYGLYSGISHQTVSNMMSKYA